MSDRELFDLEIMSYLTRHLDEKLADYGFVRDLAGRHYHRNIGKSAQSIIFHFEVEPRDDPSQKLLIRPKIQIKFPALSEVAREITRHNPLLLPAPDIVIAAPICPDLDKSIKIGWFARSHEERVRAIEAGCLGILSFAIPFLQVMTSPSDLLEAYEKKDGRLKMNRRMMLFIVAAYIQESQMDEADRIASCHLDRGRDGKALLMAIRQYTAL